MTLQGNIRRNWIYRFKWWTSWYGNGRNCTNPYFCRKPVSHRYCRYASQTFYKMAAATEADRRYLIITYSCGFMFLIFFKYRHIIIVMAFNSFTQGDIHNGNISNDTLPCVLVRAECLINAEMRETTGCPHRNRRVQTVMFRCLLYMYIWVCVFSHHNISERLSYYIIHLIWIN